MLKFDMDVSQAIHLETNVVKGGFEKNRLIQQSGGSFVVIDTAQGGERGGTLAGEAQTVYRRSFPCWYKQTPEAALSGGLGLRPPTSTRRVYTGACLPLLIRPYSASSTSIALDKNCAMLIPSRVLYA